MLGTSWLTRTDDFHFKFDELIKFEKTLTLTKRNVLRFGSKIYNPLGFLSPFTIRIKILFQELCIKKTHWDSPLSESHKRKYLKLISETEELNKIRVKRARQSSKAEPINREIHGFSDVSESAISAVAYPRTTYSEFGPDLRLIASKTKVAPPR